MEILPRLLYGREASLTGNSCQHSFLLLCGRIIRQKRLKLLEVPLPRLFQCRAIAAGKKQTQEIRKIARQRVDIVGRNIHRADGKHHFAKPANQAKVNSIHSSPANDFGPLGGAKIGLVPGTPLQPQRSQIDAIL